MDQDLVKEALMEIIDLGGKKGRKWFFPKNVDNQYKVFANMTLKEIAKYILPALVLCGGIAFIPPYTSVAFWIIKLLFVALIITAPVLYVNYRPVKHRENIRTKDFIKEYLDYKQKQKNYFIKPKNRFGGE